MSILDFHTHRTDAPDALISVDPRRFDPLPGLWYSVGYHPWDEVDALTDEDFTILEQCARHPQVLAVGETGIDRLRGASLDIQAAVFQRHLQLAANLGLPVIVHCVRAAQEILAARHQADLDKVPMAIHGMRANEHVARVLLDAGCHLSFGPRFNASALHATPLDRLLIETDDTPDTTIHEVATLVATTLQLPTQEIITTASHNAHHLLSFKE